VTAEGTSNRSNATEKSSTAQIPLWRQLQSTAIVLIAVHAGKSWATAQLDVDPALRSGVQALSFAVLRNLGTGQALRKLLAKRAPPAPADALLCTVLALAVAQDDVYYEAHTLVDQAVEAAKRSPSTRAQASFINACLRRFLREKDALLQAALRDPQAQYNHPAWWIKRLQQDHPAQWQQILQANAGAAPLTLRINTSKTSVGQYLQAWAATKSVADIKPVGACGVELAHSQYVPGLPGYAEGLFSVQDAAAQLAAPLLLQNFATTTTLLRVLDACAAPGGKTAHLLEYAAAHSMPVHVTALDVDAQRCQRIHENLARLQLQAQVLTADAGDPAAWWDGQAFDAILLDAPCTASGIVRRHPDVRWLRRESDIAQLVEQQKRLLTALWPLLKNGGYLLYCTCSVFKAEGQDQIQTFVTHNTHAALQPSAGHLLPQKVALHKAIPDNSLGGHDGFYYALLQKN
jgi:16S rRNA (cytosine967-C5)-methyltransferase